MIFRIQEKEQGFSLSLRKPELTEKLIEFPSALLYLHMFNKVDITIEEEEDLFGSMKYYLALRGETLFKHKDKEVVLNVYNSILKAINAINIVFDEQMKGLNDLRNDLALLDIKIPDFQRDEILDKWRYKNIILG